MPARAWGFKSPLGHSNSLRHAASAGRSPDPIGSGEHDAGAEDHHDEGRPLEPDHPLLEDGKRQQRGDDRAERCEHPDDADIAHVRCEEEQAVAQRQRDARSHEDGDGGTGDAFAEPGPDQQDQGQREDHLRNLRDRQGGVDADS